LSQIKDKTEYLAIFAGLMVSVIFGFSFLFTKEALDSIQPFHLLGFRFACAALSLTILKFLGLIKIDFKAKKINILLILALFQPVAYFIFETLGLKLSTASEAGMMIALIPVVVAILAAVFLGEVPSNKQLLCIITSVLGVLFIIVMKSNTQFSKQATGLFLLLGAVFSAGIYNILSRKSSLEFSSVEITYIMMMIGAVAFNGVSLVRHYLNNQLSSYFVPLANIDILMAVLYLGVLSSVMAFLMVNFMLAKLEAYKSAVFTNLTTIISVLAGVLLRGEPFYWFHLLGGLLIILGVWGTNYYGNQAQKYELDTTS
jgi:drug/metabolite transporter (DMT)-like permease